LASWQFWESAIIEYYAQTCPDLFES